MRTRRTLHEAIKIILEEYGSMRVKQVLEFLNKFNLYKKKDFSELKVSQIYARINKYSELFYLNEDGCLCLN